MNISDRQQQLGRFWKKYLRLTRAGVGVVRSLEVIQAEEPSPELSAVIGSLRQHLEDGCLLSEGLRMFPEYFSPAAVEMILTAERNGEWDLVVEELAEGLLEGTFD